MGCTDCGKKGGCDSRKADERRVISQILTRIYPDRRWGAPDDEARFRAGVGELEGRRLARRVAAVLEAPVYYRPAAEDALCDWLYVLCVGRAPGLVELREAASLDGVDGERIRERYLRVALSSVGRVAALQEVALELDREPGGFVVREQPRDGVYDPILLARTQKLIELLVESDIAYLDFGLLTAPPERYADGFGADGSDAGYRESFGQAPRTVNYLFYPEPSSIVGTTYVPARPG
jgi:hypothetical protein